ncbi:hypothetical protein L0P88_04160 [Muricauda sp. SCSIO 64092]|uniref:hypothetical protein n=1 Tax=Allomuricauda sp. SCSIO 64092 TaxID=2908842 RepID=UPI001FF5C3CD|nr:hypothetical protein [Muricauda sp. SCSIO 64092]UOY07749.1 hypothetical protein L0P88_04160 [Muricauda sp. SCSIO 64092]
MNKINLGVRAKDKITGFTGIVISKSQWLTGCDRVALKPPVDKDGKEQEASWFDIGAVEYLDEGINAIEVQADKTGGPQKDDPVA